MVAMMDLKSIARGRGSSSLPSRTKKKHVEDWQSGRLRQS
jgi:hypothetical protein